MEFVEPKTREEMNDYLKTRIESLGLSMRTQNALELVGIRTVGGIVRKTESSLKDITGLGIKGIKEIKEVLNSPLGISFPSDRYGEIYPKPLPISDLNIPQEEVRDFLKLPIDMIHLSVRTSNALENAGIRTVGGLIRKKSLLPDISGLGIKGIEEIKEKLKGIEEAKENLKKSIFVSNNGTKKSDIPINTNDIIGVFAKYFNVSKEIILEHNRKKEIVAIRDLIAYFLREYADMSFPSIGKLLGGRDHTTIIHAYRKLQKDIMISNLDFESKFAELITEIKSIKERKDYVQENIIPQILESARSSVAFGKHRLKFKEIQDREKKILELYKEGLTFKNIASVIGITRARIYQIIKNTIRQSVINEFFENQTELDDLTLVTEEKKRTDEIKNQRNFEILKNKPPKPAKPIRVATWSRHYVACRSCGTTVIPHFKNGLCENCGHKSIGGDARENMIAEHENKCDICGIIRDDAHLIYGRDFYLSRQEGSVLCKKCHLNMTGKKLGSFKKNKWRMFYK